MAKQVFRNVVSIFLALLAFFLVIFVVCVLVAKLVGPLLQIKVVAVLVRFFVTIPISFGWIISEETALFAAIGSFVYLLAQKISYHIIDKIGGHDYFPFLMVGIILLVIYIPSLILRIVAKQPFWADIYGIVVAVTYINEKNNF